MELTIDQALQKAIEAYKAGQIQEADRLYTAILKAQPKHPDANHNLGVLAVSVGKANEALPFLKAALEANPSIAQFWLSYIDALIKLDRISEAKAVLDKARSLGAKGDSFDELDQRLQTVGQLPLEVDKVAKGQQLKQPNILDSLKLDQAIKLAKKNEGDGALEEAKRIYQDVLLRFPKNNRAKEGLKRLDRGANVSKSKTQDPPQDHVQSLINLYYQGQVEQALSQADTLLKQFPNSATLFNIQGAILKDLGQLDLSVEAYKKALDIKPDYADAYNNMGNALQDQDQLEEAIKAYKKALDIKPDHADAYNNIGNALQDQGKLEEAIEAYKKAIAIKPDQAEAHNNMGATLQDQDKLEEAIEAYKKALDIKPDYADAYNNMGNALQDQGKLEEAIESYKKAIAIKPDHAEAHNNMGNALRDQGKLEEAIEAYKKAIAYKPDHADAYNNMGATLQDQDKLEEAIEAYKKALDIKPDYADAYNNMSNALRDQGKLEEAIEAYKKAIAYKPDHADAYNNMGATLQDQGKLEEAIEAYKKAIAIKPDQAEAYNNMGNALTGMAFRQPNPGLQKIIISLLDKKTIVRPSDISSAAISLLKFEPKLKQHLQTSFLGEPEPKLLKAITDLSELPLLLKLMSVCPLPDLALENLLRDLRASLLLSISDITGSAEELKFQSALALQCFTNEYIYNHSEHEGKALTALEAVIKQTLSSGYQPSPQSVLCLASYRPLNQYDWSSSLRVSDEIEEVFTRQIVEPKQEANLRIIFTCTRGDR